MKNAETEKYTRLLITPRTLESRILTSLLGGHGTKPRLLAGSGLPARRSEYVGA